MFAPGKSGREIWGLEISRFPGNLCRDPWKFFYTSKGFGGTDIYRSDIKNALLQIQNFLRRNACKIKFFSLISRKN